MSFPNATPHDWMIPKFYRCFHRWELRKKLLQQILNQNIPCIWNYILHVVETWKYDLKLLCLEVVMASWECVWVCVFTYECHTHFFSETDMPRLPHDWHELNFLFTSTSVSRSSLHICICGSPPSPCGTPSETLSGCLKLQIVTVPIYTMLFPVHTCPRQSLIYKLVTARD